MFTQFHMCPVKLCTRGKLRGGYVPPEVTPSIGYIHTISKCVNHILIIVFIMKGHI